MEQKVNVICPNCSYEEKFKLGDANIDSKYSLLHSHDEDGILNKVDKEEQEKIKSIVKHGGILQNGYGYKVYMCNKCHYIYNRYYFDIKISNDRYESNYKCPICRGRLQVVDLSSMVEFKCKKCKKDVMTYIA